MVSSQKLLNNGSQEFTTTAATGYTGKQFVEQEPAPTGIYYYFTFDRCAFSHSFWYNYENLVLYICDKMMTPRAKMC